MQTATVLIEKIQTEKEKNNDAQNKIRSKAVLTDEQISNGYFLQTIATYDDAEFEKGFTHPLVNINCTKVPDLDGELSQFPPISLAILRYNRKALDRLLEKGAQITTPDINGKLPITSAVIAGDCLSINALIRHGASLRFKGKNGSALHYALRNVTGFSLLSGTTWDNDPEDSLGQALMNWFEGDGPKPKLSSLSGEFSGHTDLIELILKLFPESVVNNESDQPKPTEIAKNPKLLLNRFRDDEGNLIKCEAGTDGVLILRDFYIHNRDLSESIHIKEIRYDFTWIREQLLPSSDLKSLRERVEQTEKLANAANAKAHEAKSKADNAHSKADEAKSKADAVDYRVSPLVQAHDPKKAALDARVKEILKDKHNTALKKFYDTIRIPLDALFPAYKTMSTDLALRKDKDARDYIATAIQKVGSALTFPFNIPGSLAGALATYYKDEKAKGKFQQIRDLLPDSDHIGSCARKIAVVLSEWLATYLSALPDAEVVELANEAWKIIIDKLYKNPGTFNSEEPIEEQLIQTVQSSEAFQKVLNAKAAKKLESKLKAINAIANHQVVFKQIHTKLQEFWNKFAEGYAKTADNRVKTDYNEVMKSLAKMTGLKEEVVRKHFSSYSHQIVANEKIRTLNPLSMQLIALSLTESVIKKGVDLSTIKTGKELSGIAENVAKHALGSIFTSLCAGSNSSTASQNLDDMDEPTADGTNKFSWILDNDTLDIINATKKSEALNTYLAKEPLLNPDLHSQKENANSNSAVANSAAGKAITTSYANTTKAAAAVTVFAHPNASMRNRSGATTIATPLPSGTSKPSQLGAVSKAATPPAASSMQYAFAASAKATIVTTSSAAKVSGKGTGDGSSMASSKRDLSKANNDAKKFPTPRKAAETSYF